MADAAVRSAKGRFVRYVVVVLLLAMSLAYVVLTFDWRAIGAALANANLLLLIVGGCSTILAYFAVRAARWAVVLRGSGIRLPFVALYRWSVFSQAAIIVTPFQSGEMVKIELMRSAGLGTRIEGYGGLVVERAADVGVLIVIAAVAVLANLDRLFAFASAVWVVAALGAVGLAVLLVVARRRLGFLTDLARSASDVARHPGVLVAVVGLTFVSWSIVALGWLLCFRSVGVVVSIGEALGLVAVVTLVNVASLIPGAVGVSEVGITECLLRLGQTSVQAQTGAMIIRAYALEVLVLAAVHALAWRSIRSATSLKDETP